MAMTRKHYREAAEVIRGEALVTSEYADLEGMIKLGRRQAAREIANGLADMFERDNPAFRRGQFMEACGL